MLGLIFFVLVLVATIVFAILGSKVWHWAHVLVAVGLVLATFGFTNLGYRVLSERIKYQKSERDALAGLAEQQKIINAIDQGTDDPAMVNRLREPLGLDEETRSLMSIGELQHELRMVRRERGRLWDDVTPQGQPDQNGQVDVAVAEDAPAMNVSQNAILYVFEQGPADKSQYIGEFRVVQAAPRQLRLEPVLTMNPGEQERYIQSAGSRRSWTLHETMPIDSHELFSGISEEQLRAMLPESSVQEYLRDGGEVRPDDDPYRIMGIDADGRLVGPKDLNADHRKVYRRKLRDYAYLFQEQAKRQSELRAEGRSLTSTLAQLQESQQGAEKIKAFRAEEQRNVKHDLAGATRDQKAAEDHLAILNQQLQNAKKLLDRTLAANARTAEQLASLQAALAGVDLSTTPAPSRSAVDQHAL
ncbi:MAG: hypothetical protein KDA37_15090 [Planctomycetales bacterium]|nr:hypothetical protein [Planctomycetales bacterium]